MPADHPYVDRPLTDLASATAVATEQARRWGLPAPTLIRRGMNALFAAGEVVLRVGHATGPAAAAHELVSVLRAHGIPTVEPVAGLTADREGVAVTGWCRVEASDDPIEWRIVGAVVRRVHGIPLDAVPTGYPVPSPTSFPWWDFDALLADVGDDIDARALAGIRAALERHAGWRQAVTAAPVLCHGDVHPGNVLVGPDGPLLIDWDLLCHAAPAWDHAMLTTLASRWGGDPAVYPGFAEGYGESMADDALTQSLGELRNVAATLMRVRAGRSDPAAAAEADRRLAYWRGESDAAWRAQ